MLIVPVIQMVGGAILGLGVKTVVTAVVKNAVKDVVVSQGTQVLLKIGVFGISSAIGFVLEKQIEGRVSEAKVALAKVKDQIKEKEEEEKKKVGEIQVIENENGGE